MQCSCVTYDELLPGVSRAEKIFAHHNPFLSLAGGRRRSKLTNREVGGDDDDRVLAVSFWLRRARRRTGATAVRFRGAGKPFFAPRSPAFALLCTRRAYIALGSLFACAAHSSLHHHSFTWQVAFIVLAKLRASVGVVRLAERLAARRSASMQRWQWAQMRADACGTARFWRL